MTILEIISKKRDGFELSTAEIQLLIGGFTRGTVPDYQMSAFLMAVYLNGMSVQETAALTQSMLDSGERISWEKSQATVDKHSTGGVGDKVSLILAAILAAGGLSVPMIAGRGLEHTGGTLDKLESIPGFSVDLNISQFKKQVHEIGLAIIGQGTEIVPADKKIYALRDVTGTVASLPLITGSIMSKKIAEGISHLLLDIKCGNGAFMKTEADAIELANSLIDTGKQFSISVAACISSMDQPLGVAIGNSLEIRECIAALNGNGPVDLMTLTHYQAARLFLASAKVKSIESGIDYSIEQIKNGKALERFRELIEWQGGDSNVIDDPDRLPVAEQIISIEAKQDGFLKSVHTTELGMLAVDLGAGRRVLTDQIRHGNGIEFFKKIGYSVSRGEEIARIHCDDSFDHKEIKKRFLALLEFDSQPVQADKLIRLYIDPQKTVHQITD